MTKMINTRDICECIHSKMIMIVKYTFNVKIWCSKFWTPWSKVLATPLVTARINLYNFALTLHKLTNFNKTTLINKTFIFLNAYKQNSRWNKHLKYLMDKDTPIIINLHSPKKNIYIVNEVSSNRFLTSLSHVFYR